MTTMRAASPSIVAVNQPAQDRHEVLAACRIASGGWKSRIMPQSTSASGSRIAASTGPYSAPSPKDRASAGSAGADFGKIMVARKT